MSYRNTVMADSPYSYWRMGELSGTSAVDECGNADGTYSGTGYTLATAGALFDDPDKCVAFDGTDAALTALSAALSAGTQSQITIEAWIYKNEHPNTDQLLMTRVQWSLRLIGQSARFGVIANGASLYSATSRAFPLHTWTHVVGTYSQNDQLTGGLYLDGVEQSGGATPPTGDAIDASVADLTIGANPAGSTFSNLRIDEVAIYTTKLSAARVMAHYLAGARMPNLPPSRGSG